MLGRIGLILTFWKMARLAWRLLWDRRAPLHPKLILFVGLLYVLSPVDVAIDLLPILGQLDDLTVLLLVTLLFLRLCPRELVREHLEVMAGRTPRQEPATPDPAKVIDGQYEILE